MPTSRCLASSLALLPVIALSGCAPPEAIPRFAPRPAGEAIRHINSNAELIQATLQATGSVDGRGRDGNGELKSYHLNGTMFFRPPHHLRFDLKKLGSRQLLLGANETHYWVEQKDGDSICARHDSPDDWSADLPAEPLDLISALALTPVALKDGAHVVRNTNEYQQILVVDGEPGFDSHIGREYWIDLRPPFLIRRVILRDQSGSVRMEMRLSEFRRVKPSGVWLPYQLFASWPEFEATMEFRVRRWRFVEKVTPTSKQFLPPEGCE